MVQSKPIGTPNGTSAVGKSPGQKFFYNGRCAAVLQNLSHVPREVERIDFSDPRSQPEGLLTAPALRGEHNRLNILAAASVAASLGCAPFPNRQSTAVLSGTAAPTRTDRDIRDGDLLQ